MLFLLLMLLLLLCAAVACRLRFVSTIVACNWKWPRPATRDSHPVSVRAYVHTHVWVPRGKAKGEVERLWAVGRFCISSAAENQKNPLECLPDTRKGTGRRRQPRVAFSFSIPHTVTNTNTAFVCVCVCVCVWMITMLAATCGCHALSLPWRWCCLHSRNLFNLICSNLFQVLSFI